MSVERTMNERLTAQDNYFEHFEVGAVYQHARGKTVTENDAVDSAVEAMKIGAFDYMAKPVDKVRLKTNVERAIEMHTMVNKIQRLQGELKKTYSYKNIVGQSDAMQQVFAQIRRTFEHRMRNYPKIPTRL